MGQWAIGLALAGGAAGCSITLTKHTVGRDFQLKVTDGALPVAGLKLVLDSRGTVVTDHRGVARFRHVPPGEHFVVQNPAYGLGSQLALVVKPEVKPHVVLSMIWPDRPVRTSSLRGKLHLADWSPASGPNPPLHLELEDARTGQILGRLDGRMGEPFAFPDPPPGYYILQVKDGIARGSVPIHLQPEAPESMDLRATITSCGLRIVNLMACPASTLTLGRAAGRVADAFGALVEHALVRLEDQQGKLVEQGESGAGGRFALPEQRDGAYRLVVSRMGYATWRANLRLEAKGAATLGTVRLGLESECSTVEPEL